MSAEPFAFATKSGAVVLKSTLDNFAIKSIDEMVESQQLKEPKEMGKQGIKEPLYPPKTLSFLAEMNTYHASCAKAKATDVGGLGWYIEPIGDNPNPKNKELLEEFFNKCYLSDDYPTFEDLLSAVQQDEEEIGYCAMELLRKGGPSKGEPDRLEYVPSHTIRIHESKKKFIQTWDNNSKIWFKRINYENEVNKDDGEETNVPEDKRAGEILFRKNHTSRSTYYGTPDSTPANRTMIGDTAAVDFNIAFFKNFGIPEYAIFISGFFEDAPELDEKTGKPTGRSIVQAKIEEKYKEVINNPHSSMFFSVPTKDASAKVEIRFERLSVDIKESSFRLYRMDNRDEVIVAHRMDPYRIGITAVGSLGGNTSENMRKNYNSGVIKPRKRSWESLINNQVIHHKNGFGIQDHRFRLIQLDVNSLEDDEKLFDMAALSPNDVRQRHGMEPVKLQGMDDYYVKGRNITSSTPGDVAKVLDKLADDLEEAVKNENQDNKEVKGILKGIKKFAG